MTMTSKATTLVKVLTGAVWFGLGVAITLILYPALTAGYPSEIVRVEFVNASSAPIHVALFLSNGDVVGSTVDQASESSLVVHAGEYFDPDFPHSMRVLIVDDSNKQIMNMEFKNKVENQFLISAPESFEIGEISANGVIEKTVKFRIHEKATL